MTSSSLLGRLARKSAEGYRSLPGAAQFLLFAACAAVALVSGVEFAIIPLTFAFLKLQGRTLDSLGLSLSRRRLRQFAGGLLLGFLMVIVICLLFRWVSKFQWERNGQATTTIWLAGIWFYLKSGIFEELIFRSYGFQRLQESIGIRWAQTVTAVLFAIYHVANVGMPLAAALLFTGAGSVLFGYAFIRSRGVMLPIGIHASWNFWQEQLAGTSGRGQPGIWRVVHEPGAELLFGVSYGLVLAVTLAAMLIIRWGTQPVTVPAAVSAETCN